MAFSIDFEVENQGSSGVKLYCDALSLGWEVQKFNSDLTKLAQEIAAIEECKKSGIPVELDVKDTNAVELYINRLGCTAASLKSVVFQKFLNMPSEVQSGIQYVSDKPFGDVKSEKTVTVHSRHVRRSGSVRVLHITSDRRGGYLLLFGKASDEKPVQTLKIAAKQLIFTFVESIPNCLAIKSANRQWAVQFQSYNDLKEVVNAINEILKSVKSDLIDLPAEGSTGKGASAMSAMTGGVSPTTTTTTATVTTTTTVTATVTTSAGNGAASPEPVEDMLAELTSGDVASAFGSGADAADRLQQENETLKQELEQLRSQVENMTERVNQLKKEKNMQLTTDGDVETKILREIDVERRKITDSFRIEIQNLKNHIKDLKPMLKAQSAVKNVPVEEKKEEKAEEKQEFQQDANAKEWEDKVGIDIEKKVLQNLGNNQEKGQIRFRHIHVHRHEFKHIHYNNHIHIDEEMIKEIPNIDEKFKNKHTVRHTISHTNSQYLVPKKWFQT